PAATCHNAHLRERIMTGEDLICSVNVDCVKRHGTAIFYTIFRRMLTLYHCTTKSVARQILANGFRDHTARYLTDREWTGVWVSDRPLYNTEGASGDTLLQIKIAEEIVAPYEWLREGKPYREWLVPAAVL